MGRSRSRKSLMCSRRRKKVDSSTQIGETGGLHSSGKDSDRLGNPEVDDKQGNDLNYVAKEVPRLQLQV